MKKITLIVIMFLSLPLYGQKKPDYRILNVPEVNFFRYLYRDDFIGDTLVIDDKIYYFSQSPMKQSSMYMMDKEDFRYPIPGIFQTKGITWGMPDKGYVLHFSVGKDGMTQVDRATYNGTIYPEEQGQPLESILLLNAMGKLNRVNTDSNLYYPLSVVWLHGRYRLNDKQVVPGRPYEGKRYVAVFEHGKLIKLRPDVEKENYRQPLVDMSERPEGMSMHDYVPEYVYYMLPNGEREKEKLEVVRKKWLEKVMTTFRTEPFLDKDCVDALKEMWIKN